MPFDVPSYLLGKQSGGGGGGGSSPWTKLAEQDFTVSTTSTSATDVGTIDAGASAWTSAKMVYIRVRDKAGKRNGYYYGNDAFLLNCQPANGSTSAYAITAKTSFGYVNSKWVNTTSSYGIYAENVDRYGTVSLRAKYSSSYGTIDGTYVVEVYALPWPKGDSPFKEATA